MPLTLRWEDIALRLALTVIAGALIGFNRSEGGHSAGLRTTLLVCLTASVAMIQTNLLISISGRTPQSIVSLDPMRLPLGILTGMGFIGGGAILKKDDTIHGVTTAATLWLATVIGLCLGGGQLALGIAATALALLILSVLKWLQANMRQVHHARLDIVVDADGPGGNDLRAALLKARFAIKSCCFVSKRRSGRSEQTIHFELKWKAIKDDLSTPRVIDELATHPGVKELRWKAY